VIADPGLVWPFTAWFAIIGLLSGAGLLRAARWPDRASYAAHVLMSAVMAAMPWPWFMAAPWPIWVVASGLAAIGYLALAIGGAGVEAGPGAGHHARRLVAWYHAGMMLGMAWMSALMALLASATETGDVGGVGTELLMPGHGGSLTPAAGDAPPLWHLPLWAIATTFAFAAMYAVATGWFLLQLRSAGASGGRRPLPERVELGLSAAMAAGMAVAYFVMS